MPELSRRSALTMLGAGALAAAGTAGVRAAMRSGDPDTASGPVAGAGPDNPTRAENRLPGTTDWRVGASDTVAADDLGRQIAGYSATTSVDLGGSIDFHVSSRPARPFTVSIYRLGEYGGLGGRHMTDSPVLAGAEQRYPVPDPQTGTIDCDWQRSWTLDVPRSWTSGMYLAAFTTDDGHRSFAPFAVRDDRRRADFLVVLPFTTYQAYNQWPLDGAVGKSLYYGYGKNSGASTTDAEGGEVADPHGVPVSYGTRARAVCFDRPYSGTGLPQRVDLDVDFVQWAERSGYDIAYATSLDLHDGRIDASRYRTLVFSGHDEYWSAQMRQTVTTALANGCSLAFMTANNVYWHIRAGDKSAGGVGTSTNTGATVTAAESRLMTCYKTDTDPAPDASGPTTLWRLVGTGAEQAEQCLVGIQFNGIPAKTVPLVVSNSDHWFWEGTGLHDGDKVPGIVGGEVDGINHGAPGPQYPRQVVLSASPFVAADDGGRARAQHTSLCETVDGALIFAAGTFNWSPGLNRPGVLDPRIVRATENLFARLRVAGPTV
jgi:hypothetical protein